MRSAHRTHTQTLKNVFLDLIKQVPGVVVHNISSGAKHSLLHRDIDIDQADTMYGSEIELATPSKQNWRIVMLTRESGEPRLIRESCARLTSAITQSRFPARIYPIVAASYITTRAAGICKEMNVGYLDLSGNCRLVFDSIFIERQGFQNKNVEKRPLRSIFSAKSSRVLRLLLEKPHKSWQVQELAENAEISLGLASKVKQRLLDLEFAITTGAGLKLRDPATVLHEWSRQYSYRDNEMLECYAPGSMNENESQLYKHCRRQNLRCALTLFPGSNRVAPFVSGISQSAMYVDAENLQAIANALGWRTVSSGSNFLILKPYDDFVLHGIQTKREWLYPVVNDIQLYLDLASHKTRGQEAAEFLLDERIRPQWEAARKRA